MPVPATIADLDAAPANNSPLGSENARAVDDYLRTLSAFVRQLSDAIDTLQAQVGSGGLTTVNWASVTGAGKPADNATVGAPSGTAVAGMPAETLVTNVTAALAAAAAAAGTANWTSVAGRPLLFRALARGLHDTQAPGGLVPGLYNGETGARLSPSDSGIAYRVCRIDPATGAVTFFGPYNTWAGGTAAADMAAVLNATTAGTVVAVISDDEPSAHRLDSGLDLAMYRCGASRAVFGSSEFQYRGAYVLVGMAGSGEGGGFEAYNGSVPSDTNAWADVSFMLVSGRLIVSGTSATPRTLRDYGYVGALNATTRQVVTVTAANVAVTGQTGSPYGPTSLVASQTITPSASCDAMVAFSGSAVCTAASSAGVFPDKYAAVCRLSVWVNGVRVSSAYQLDTFIEFSGTRNASIEITKHVTMVAGTPYIIEVRGQKTESGGSLTVSGDLSIDLASTVE